MNVNRGIRMIAAASVLAVFAGCGGRDLPDLAPVAGTVTLDDEPLAGVLVSFYPSSGGRPGSGVTDEQGHYELMYLDGEEGTKPGPNRIEVTTIWPDGEPGDGEVDRIPAAYQGIDSSLAYDVQPNDNVYDIAIWTDAGEGDGNASGKQ